MIAARTLFSRAALLASLAAALASGGASAAAVPASGVPVAARIDGQPVYAFTVDALWRQRRVAKPSLERRATLADLIDVRLLAARANALSSKEDSGKSAGVSVAYATDVMVEERLVSTLREAYGKEIEAAVQALPGATLDSLIMAEPPMPQTTLATIFGRPGPLLLEIALSAEQQLQAATVEVLRYRLPGAAPAGVSLLDVYQRQNVQGRLALSQHPAKIAAQQARQILAGAFVLHWAGQRFGAEAVADLRKAIADGEAVMALQNLHGVGLHTDSGSPLLNRLAGEVAEAEIEAFYHRHKDLFARIEKVRARHIRLADEAQAQRAVKALQGGAGFASVARKMSRAPDAAKGGDLGWIGADGKQDWLTSLVFSQPPGKPSAPIRAPVGPNDPAFWEIVLVEERVHGAHPLRSETVRYQASRLIAQEKAMRQLGEMTEQARRAARIEIVEEQ